MVYLVKKTQYKHYLNDISNSINKQKYNNTIFSKWSEIKHSVPQGSILGPLLFLLCSIYMIKLR